MIVAPDFLDHWKTLMLVDDLGGDPLAPLYVLRIWAHCQSRKKATGIEISAAGLRALCRCASVTAEQLEAALVKAGFIEREGAVIHVCEWATYNASLIAAWKNGKNGGRPKAANANPSGTENEPNANPSETHGEAIRGDKKREEEKQKPKAARNAPPALQLVIAAGVDEQTAADWIAHRKAKRATASATVIEDRKRECAKAGVSLAEGLALEVSRGWQGLKAEWITNASQAQAARPQLPFQSQQDKARQWADLTTGGSRTDDQRIIDITPAAPQLG